jgi:hypothetical protein
MSETLTFNLATIEMPCLTPAKHPRWSSALVGSLTEAEQLLDVIEADRYRERELLVQGSRAFVVRWR